MIKTFRGQLADDGQDRIRLQTIRGKVGYRIAKFQVMGITENQGYETTVLIYKSSQSTVVVDVNFTDSNLLAAILYGDSGSAGYSATQTVIFDNEIFNQDIFITCKSISAAVSVINYYLELEVIPLDDAGAEYTTLKDMRQA